jgi:hypothetical protein
MPESLTTLLQQHVDRLSHAPATGFPGVRAKARRRSRQRVAAATLATVAVVTLGAVLGNAALSDNTHPAPTKPAPTSVKAATLLDTHWQFTAVTTNGHTLTLDDTQDYLTMSLNGWQMREHCQNISGGVTLGQQIQLFTQVKGTPTCQGQPLPAAVTEILHSPLTDTLAGQTLTLNGGTGSMSFTAEQPDPSVPPPVRITSRIWRLTQIHDLSGNRDLENYQTQPGSLWLTFGKGHWLGNDDCNEHQGGAVFTSDFLDLTGGPTIIGTACVAGSAHEQIAGVYDQLVKDGRLLWTVTGGKLELRGVNTVVDFLDAGPASALCGGGCDPSGS